ncbi:hypothetical protein PoB_006800100 [Plakobranchus ocellatus]|uniref:Post-GPI attachment to proteins factor 3 n=1 Tax=Plakobranchus ocellatus TaxID=259542 RepID=A0AAV4DBQ0_9GAST|nr:hypothetical protein PoB_006800100 [Plakobranchus ocellatus]
MESSGLLQAAQRKAFLKFPLRWLVMLLLGLAMLVWSSDGTVVCPIEICPLCRDRGTTEEERCDCSLSRCRKESGLQREKRLQWYTTMFYGPRNERRNPDRTGLREALKLAFNAIAAFFNSQEYYIVHPPH